MSGGESDVVGAGAGVVRGDVGVVVHEGIWVVFVERLGLEIVFGAHGGGWQGGWRSCCGSLRSGSDGCKEREEEGDDGLGMHVEGLGRVVQLVGESSLRGNGNSEIVFGGISQAKTQCLSTKGTPCAFISFTRTRIAIPHTNLTSSLVYFLRILPFYSFFIRHT